MRVTGPARCVDGWMPRRALVRVARWDGLHRRPAGHRGDARRL